MRQAEVTSIESIHAFRSHFIAYVIKAGLALDQAAEETTRTRLWLQNDQRSHWEREVRQRRAALAQARAQLLSAQLRDLSHSTGTAKHEVRRAEHALAEAEQKLACVRHEARRYDSVVTPMQKELDKLRMFLSDAGPKATAFLTGVVDALQAYAETHAGPTSSMPQAPPTGTGQPTPDSALPGDTA